MDNKKYCIKFLPSDKDVKESPHVFYDYEIWENVPILNNWDSDIYTFIIKKGEKQGHHEKWQNLIAIELYVCDEEGNIIGEVSEKADWVKEGMKFSAEELLQQGSGVNLSPRKRSFVQIKCPTCNHYH